PSGHAEIFGLPGNWRWRSRDHSGHVVTSRAGYSSVSGAVDDIVKLFGEDYPIEVVRLDQQGAEVTRHWHRPESSAS
ncbi:MAG TPA: hypothetical protein VHE80_07405, partial [Acidimicrobiales bacterium]|nr:hypothetical protein [Acidimicrobiales bacterium]